MKSFETCPSFGYSLVVEKLSEGEMRLLRKGRGKQMKGETPRDSKKEGTNTMVWDGQVSFSPADTGKMYAR